MAVGPEWLFKAGGGALFGRVDVANGEDAATGANVVYVYPDNSTMLVGSFQGGNSKVVQLQFSFRN